MKSERDHCNFVLTHIFEIIQFLNKRVFFYENRTSQVRNKTHFFRHGDDATEDSSVHACQGLGCDYSSRY